MAYVEDTAAALGNLSEGQPISENSMSRCLQRPGASVAVERLDIDPALVC
jgi:hypothetical protein